MDGNPVVTWKQYGRVRSKLADLMDAKGLTRNAVAQMVHTRFEVIDRLYSDQSERVDLDILARICFVLDCDVKDLLEYDKAGAGR